MAIKPTPQNKGQNGDTKSRLNGWDLRYVNHPLYAGTLQMVRGLCVSRILKAMPTGAKFPAGSTKLARSQRSDMTKPITWSSRLVMGPTTCCGNYYNNYNDHKGPHRGLEPHTCMNDKFYS